MHLTIIAYRPNGEDTHMGCLMGSSDSSFEVYHPDSDEQGIDKVAQYLFNDMVSEREYCNHKITILVDGYDEYTNPSDWQISLINTIRIHATTKADKLFKEYETEQSQKKQLEKDKEDATDRARDLQQLAKLKTKYEV